MVIIPGMLRMVSFFLIVNRPVVVDVLHRLGANCGIIYLMMCRQPKVLTPLNLVFEIILSKVSIYSPANFARNHLLTLLPVLHISVFIQ